MVSSNKVLSKITLYVLRGAIFTTSFSIVLLAEERRRRINVAYAILDNARTIRSFKNYRGSAKSDYSQRSIEEHLTKLGKESFVTDSGEPFNPFRRGQRRNHEQGNDEDFDPVQGMTGNLESTLPADAVLERVKDSTAQLNAWARLKAERRMQPEEQGEMERVGIDCSDFDQHFAQMTTDSGQISDSMLPTIVIADEIKDSTTQSDVWAACAKANHEFESAIPDLLMHNMKVAKEFILGIKPKKTVKVYQMSRDTPTRLERQLETTGEDMPDIFQKEEREYTYKTFPILGRRILAKLASSVLQERHNIHRAQGFKLALVLLGHLPGPEQALDSTTSGLSFAVRILLHASLQIESDNLDPMTQVLEASFPFFDSYRGIFDKFLDDLIKQQSPRAVEATRHLLLFLRQPPYSAAWDDGQIILYILREINLPHGLVDRYAVLKAAGLFRDICVSDKIEILIKKKMVAAACKEVRPLTVVDEVNSLRARDAEAFGKDFELQAYVVLLQAAGGSLDDIISSVRDLEVLGPSTSPGFQKLLEQIMDLFAQTRDAMQLKALAIYFFKTYGLKAQARWTVAVLERLSQHRDLDAMTEWQQLCFDNGLMVNFYLVDAFFEICRKFWSFRPAELFEMRSQAMPFHKDSFRGGLQAVMKMFAKRGDWRMVCNMFDQGLSRHKTISPICIRDGLKAHITMRNGDTTSAWTSLEMAQRYGHSTELAMSHVIAAEAKRGTSTGDILAMAADRGLTIDAASYFTAAKIRNAEEKRFEAIAILEQAAAHLGQGQMALDQNGFAMLLRLYISTRQHSRVHLLLDEFNSQMLYWHGHKECKESIKHAIKELTKQEVFRRELIIEPGAAGTASVVGTAAGVGEAVLEQPDGPLFHSLEAALKHYFECRAKKEHRDMAMEKICRMFIEHSQKSAKEWSQQHDE